MEPPQIQTPDFFSGDVLVWYCPHSSVRSAHVTIRQKINSVGQLRDLRTCKKVPSPYNLSDRRPTPNSQGRGPTVRARPAGRALFQSACTVRQLYRPYVDWTLGYVCYE